MRRGLNNNKNYTEQALDEPDSSSVSQVVASSFFFSQQLNAGASAVRCKTGGLLHQSMLRVAFVTAV